MNRSQQYHSNSHLMEEIVPRSVGKTQSEAILEWMLIGICWTIDPGRCLCGHSQIKEHCVLINTLNENVVMVHSNCAEKLLGIPVRKISEGLKRIAVNQRRALTVETLDFAVAQGWITSRNRELYLSIRKSNVTYSRWNFLWEINCRILGSILVEIESKNDS